MESAKKLKLYVTKMSHVTQVQHEVAKTVVSANAQFGIK